MANGYFLIANGYSFVNRYTAHVGTMTDSSSVTSTNTYDPNKSTKVWNPRTPSTKKTRMAVQQRKKSAEYLILRLFNFMDF